MERGYIPNFEAAANQVGYSAIGWLCTVEEMGCSIDRRSCKALGFVSNRFTVSSRKLPQRRQ